jgi:hypothetical protein
MTKIFANSITQTKKGHGNAETLDQSLDVLSRDFLDNESIREQTEETDILRDITSHRLQWRNQWTENKIHYFPVLHFITDPDVEKGL